MSATTLLFSALVYTSCETTELDITQDPNFLSPSQANADLFLSSIEVDFARVVNELGEETAEVTRMLYMNNRNYQNAYSPQSFDAEWTDIYQGILKDIDIMNGIAEDAEFYTHIAIGQIIEAYVMVMAVDFFGDVPYSEALQAENGILAPKLDNGVAIYSSALTLLDNAITNLGLDEKSLPSYRFILWWR